MALDQEEFLKHLDSAIDDAVRFQEQVLQPDRERNYAYYLGENVHPAPDSRSQAVSWDVFEVVESTLPDLIEIFLGGDEIARYEPVGVEDEEFAEQATDYINYIVQKQNPGFLIFNTWIKDCLLSKLGVVRAYWAENERTTTRRYTGINDLQLTQLLEEDGAEVVEQESKPDPQDEAMREQARASINALAPEMRAQVEAFLASEPAKLYDVTIKTTRTQGRVYIDNVQPENFYVSRRAKTLDAADLVGELKAMTRSDLIEAGYPKEKVEGLTSWDGYTDDPLGLAQIADDSTTGIEESVSADRSMEEVVVFDGFIRVDYDGDGVAEWRHVVRGGNELLLNEEADGHDFVVMSPILIPHRLVGMALADPVVPIQTVNTALTRQYIDSLVLANNPRTYVNVDANVNLDDLLNNRIGGIVRGHGAMQNAVAPLTTNTVAVPALQGIEFMDSRREQRTGITRYNQGLDADSLNKTATGVTKILDAGNARKKMMARILAETGIKDLFRLLLRLVVNNQDQPATVRLRNDWVQFDPSGWSPEMDVTIETGLGTGDKSQQLATLQSVLAAQREALQAGLPLATPKNIYNTLESMLKASGIKGVSRYFQDPDEAPQQPQQPEQENPEAALAQAQVEAAQIQAQTDLQRAQIDAQVKQMQMQHDAQKHQQEMQLKAVELEMERIKLATAEAALELKRAEAITKAQLAEREQDRKDTETLMGR